MRSQPRRRKRVALTPLVDVIFLLILFFMLSSTFSRFAEVELATSSGGRQDSPGAPIFVQLFPNWITVNGERRSLADLDLAPREGQVLLVALQDDVDAQRLADLLVALRAFPQTRVAVLGAG